MIALAKVSVLMLEWAEQALVQGCKVQELVLLWESA